MATFVPDALMSWAAFTKPCNLEDIRRESEVISSVLGPGFTLGQPQDDLVVFADAKQRVTVLFSSKNLTVFLAMPEGDAAAQWERYLSVLHRAVDLPAIPPQFDMCMCSARTVYVPTADAASSQEQTEAVLSALAQGRPIEELAKAEVLVRQGPNEVSYSPTHNKKSEQHGLNLVYSRRSAPEVPLTKQDVQVFMQEENVLQRLFEEQKRLEKIGDSTLNG